MKSKTQLSTRFTKKILAYPWRSLSIGVLTFLVLSGGMPFLTSDFSYRVWFEESNPRLQAFDEFERKFGSDDVGVIGIYSDDGIFDKGTAQLLIDITEDLWQVTEVIRVDSLANFNWIHSQGDDILIDPLLPAEQSLTPDFLTERSEVAKNHKTLQGYLINEEMNATLIYINLKPSLTAAPDYKKINDQLKEVIEKYKNSDQYGSPHELYLTGLPALTFAFQDSSQQDLETLLPLVFLIALLFLAILFQKVSGVLLPLVVIFPSILATLGFSGWMGIEINVLTAIVPQFLIALAIAVIVHILVSFYQYMGQSKDKDWALQMALEKNLLPTLLTSISTAIGFLSFSTSGMPPIAKMGILSGAGTLLAWLFCYLIMGPLIKILPIKSKFQQPDQPYKKMEPTPRAYKWTDRIQKGKLAILLIFVVTCVVSTYIASKTRVSSDPFKYFSDSYPLSIANKFVEDHVGAATGIEIVIESNEAEGSKDPQFLNQVQILQNWLDAKEEVTKSVSILDILKEMNQMLGQGLESEFKLAQSRDLVSQQLFLYSMNLPQGMDLNNRMTVGSDALRLTAMVTEHDSERFVQIIDDIEDEAKKLGLKAWVTGKGALYHSNNEAVVRSFFLSLSLAIVLVSLLLLIGLRSFKMAFISLIPNTFPLLIGSGFVYLYGATLDIGTVLIGSVCLGIAVDDTIHFLTNYQIYRKQGDSPRQSIARVFSYTVPAMVTTTVVLVAAFGCFVFASFIPNKQFGIFVAFILSIALISDLIFLPALLFLIDKDSSKNN